MLCRRLPRLAGRWTRSRCIFITGLMTECAIRSVARIWAWYAVILTTDLMTG